MEQVFAPRHCPPQHLNRLTRIGQPMQRMPQARESGRMPHRRRFVGPFVRECAVALSLTWLRGEGVDHLATVCMRRRSS